MIISHSLREVYFRSATKSVSRLNLHEPKMRWKVFVLSMEQHLHKYPTLALHDALPFLCYCARTCPPRGCNRWRMRKADSNRAIAAITGGKVIFTSHVTKTVGFK